MSAGLLEPPKKPSVGRPAVLRPPGLNFQRDPSESHASEETIEPLKPRIQLKGLPETFSTSRHSSEELLDDISAIFSAPVGAVSLADTYIKTPKSRSASNS